ncbi:MAG: stress response translation initiation inhibitor YciH [Nanoarchaeota archaeon]
MSEIDPVTGLPKELGIWENIAKSEQRIQMKEEKRKFGKIITVIKGINSKEIDLKEIAKKLKSRLACGGTVKDSTIELQGTHAKRAKEELIKLGFARDSIETS